MKSPYLKMLLATLLFGSYLVVSKIILREVPVFTATFIRLASATAFILPMVLRRYKGTWVWPGKHDAAVLFTQSALGVFLFSIFAMQGVRLTGGIESGVILSLVPIAVSLISLLFLGERLQGTRMVGIVLAVAGAASISAFGNAGSTASTSWLGMGLLMCAVLCEAVFLTFGKLLRTPLPPEKLSLILAVIGTALFAIPATLEPKGLLSNAHYSFSVWLLMIYTGIAINGLAAVLIYSSMEQVDTSVAAAFTALTPVSGTLLAIVFLHEALYLNHVVGMVLACSGVFIVATAGARKARAAASAVVVPITRPSTSHGSSRSAIAN